MDSQVTIRGNVGSTVTFKSGESDGRKWSRAEFRLGSTRRLRRADGSWVDAGTTWVSVEAWSALADGIRGSIDKGDPLIVSGRLRTDEWNDVNGQVQSRLVLVADAVGHDLNRGRTRFVRNAQIPAPDDIEPAETRFTVVRDEGPADDEAAPEEADDYDGPIALAAAVGD